MGKVVYLENMLRFLAIIVMTFILSSCSDTQVIGPGGNADKDSWLIPAERVLDGGVGKDGIPALDFPPMVTADKATYLNPEDLVLVYKSDEEIRVYPHAILNFHEIINDEADGIAYAISYCPLTGTGLAWNRLIQGQVTSFGVSGLLYNGNLLPYDRASGSEWSQMRQECVHGERIGIQARCLDLLEMPWSVCQEAYPDCKVVDYDLGFGFSYEAYPYLDYNINHDFFLFPVDTLDPRLPSKERVLGIRHLSHTRIYRLGSFENGLAVKHDFLEGIDLVIAGSKVQNFLVGFEARTEDGVKLTFSSLHNQLPLIMEDHEGNQWDLFGEARSGPRQGERLKRVEAFMGFWFAWGTFDTGAEIYQ